MQSKREQLEREHEFLTSSFSKLKEVQVCFAQNISTISSMKSVQGSNQAFLPLTNMVYIGGTVSTPPEFLVDIGTGYLSQKNATTADQLYSRKIKFLQNQLLELSALIQDRRKHLLASENSSS